MKKHVHNFIADIVSRETNKMGTGTMVVKAAVVNMVADAEVRPDTPGSGQHLCYTPLPPYTYTKMCLNAGTLIFF